MCSVAAGFVQSSAVVSEFQRYTGVDGGEGKGRKFVNLCCLVSRTTNKIWRLAEPNLKMMAVLNVTISDFLRFPSFYNSPHSFLPFSSSNSLSSSRFLSVPRFLAPRERDFILYPTGLENLCPWPFHYSSYTRSETTCSFGLSLFFSTSSFHPCTPLRSVLFIFSSPLCPPFGSSPVFHCSATSQYCNVKHNTLLSRRDAPPWRRKCAERRKRLKRGVIRLASPQRERERTHATRNEYTARVP